MVWSASGVFSYTVNEALTAKVLALNASDVLYGALYAASITPSATVTTAAATYYNGGVWLASSEVNSTNYTAGGASIAGVTCTQTTNVVTLTGNSLTWTTVTFTGNDEPAGLLVYDKTSSPSLGISFNYFGGAQTVTAGNFTVAFPSGIATFTS